MAAWNPRHPSQLLATLLNQHSVSQRGRWLCYLAMLSMTHTMIPREQRQAGGLHDGLIRISVGLERAKDLVEDLKNALDLCDEDGCDVEVDI